jgi:GT2 family glycosyltransferase
MPVTGTRSTVAHLPMSRQHKPSQIMVGLVVLSATVFSAVYLTGVVMEVGSVHPRPFLLGLLAFKTTVEIGASYYGFALLFTAAAYLWPWPRNRDRSRPALARFPAVGVIYMCCDDLDTDALESLARLRYRGKLYLVVHDDSRSHEQRDAVDRAVARLRSRAAHEVMLLRRPHQHGGKPGASNYVLRKLSPLVEYLLVCDNDSTILDPGTVEAALPYFDDPSIAVVQCRNVSVGDSRSCRINRLLGRSIDAFDVFLRTYARFGWQPFVGHNALVRTSSVAQVGGFTPGFFSDDLDLTVRLNLAGYRVVYAPAIQIGERHPASYHAFRRRSYKWAYGCVQTLRAHSWAVLRSSRFSLAEKFSFFQFVGFYVAQSVLLLYLTVTLLVAPWFLRGYPAPVGEAFFAGTIMILVTYAPVLAYFARAEIRASWFGTVLLCGLVYGSSDFASARGVWDCLRQRARSWTPTNVRSAASPAWPLVGEAAYGASLLLVPLLAHSPVVYLPAFYLFAGKFLWGPTMSIMYDDERQTVRPPPVQRMRWVAQVGVLVLLVAIPSVFMRQHVGARERQGVEIRGASLLVDGRPFQVRGMHYGPWRPGTGPNKGYPYPSVGQIDSDLILIKSLHVNTIFVVDPPGYVLDVAQHDSLKVLYDFTLNWWQLGAHQDSALRQRILDRVVELRDKPALLGWVLGSEVPNAVLDTRGPEPIRAGLRSLYEAIKRLDPEHPITHANWPITRDLDVSFFDVVSFNVYPLWPPEVVARGFGNYVREVLRPIAGSKPLLITEFGANTLEAGDAGQARLLKSSWEGLVDAGACGGVVFEFADEWWKNYDNPKRVGDWWDRRPAVNDEKQHDVDPEEYYGVMTAERKPRPAAAVVQEMFSPGHLQAGSRAARLVPRFAVVLLLVAACGAWLWAKRNGARRPV